MTSDGEQALPHVIIEYSANLEPRLDVGRLVDAVHEAALATGVFPIGGVRTRAYAARFYRIADGHPDNTFVHLELRVGPGRDAETRRRACDAVLAATCTALDGAAPGIPLGVSLEMHEIDRQFAVRRNNLHEFVARRQGAPAGS
jgi:5-carboxymethyl-2-hydroxymuconate isomerase